uniref:Uncharacterized protein n=1 Tax=Anopheles maculatus TaxID=74869 RepID=A0A182T6H0_9DIPT
MINNGTGNDYLSVAGQDNLLPYKFMNDPHLLQHNFLDYDVMADASNSNSSNSNSRCSPGTTDAMHVEHQSAVSNQSDSRFQQQQQQQRQQEALGGSEVTYPATLYSSTMQVERYPSKKIRPVKRPGLVLKTPIAYKGDIDPSVIPIQRDGM